MLPNSHATTFANRPLVDVIKESHFIVRGKPQGSYSAWDKTGRKTLYSYTDFVVSEVIKGNLKDLRILVRQPGGSKDGIEMHVPGSATFVRDEEMVLLLGEKNEEDESYDVPGLATGKYTVERSEAGEPLLVNALGAGEIYDPKHDEKTLSYNSKIPLESFRKVVKGHLTENTKDLGPQFKKQLSTAGVPTAGSKNLAVSTAGVPTAHLPSIGANTTGISTATQSTTNFTAWMVIAFLSILAMGALIFWIVTKD